MMAALSRPVRFRTTGKSPLARFVESIKEQIEQNRELQQNIKQLQDESNKLSESESLRRAREIFEKAKVALPANCRVMWKAQ